MDRKHITPKQLSRLIEIDEALGGIGDQVEGIISGGTRFVRAKSVWSVVGDDLEIDTFRTYLNAIPRIPEPLAAGHRYFPEIVLVDTRISVVRLCRSLGIALEDGQNFDVEESEQTLFSDAEGAQGSEPVYWIRIQDGERYDGEAPEKALERFQGGEVGLTLFEGLMACIQLRGMLKRRGIFLTQSRLKIREDMMACLFSNLADSDGIGAKLDWIPETRAMRRCGVVSRLT